MSEEDRMRLELQRMQQKADEITDDVSTLACLGYVLSKGTAKSESE